MIELKIAFLDQEKAYLEALKGFLVRKKEFFFRVWTFSEEKTFLADYKSGKFDVLVMTEFFWKTLDHKVSGMKKILLSEGSVDASLEGVLMVSKFQSAENMFRQIVSLVWQEEEEKAVLPDKEAHLIGVYSPVGHEDQMIFSMTMAQILGEDQKVLYINLMENSGFYSLTEEPVSQDAGDFFYGMQQRKQNFHAGIHRVRQTYRNIDYIPPVINPEHLMEVSKDVFEHVLLTLKTCSGYDVVIVDFGRLFFGFAEMFPIFNAFYCIGKEGIYNRYRTESFFEYLEKTGMPVTEMVYSILLPVRKYNVGEDNLLENCLYGGMGDYIRKMLFGGEHEEPGFIS